MPKKKRRLNLDIGYADGEPVRGTTIGLDPFAADPRLYPATDPTLMEIKGEGESLQDQNLQDKDTFFLT